MTNQLLAMSTEITSTSTGESTTFWLLAPVAVLAALGMVLARNAVHSALLLVVNLFCVAVFYLVQDAPFLGFVQIIVYTGAIMVLFLFVLMLVGVDSSDSLVETLRGQRVAAILLGLGFAGLLVFPIGAAIEGRSAAGLEAANAGGNVHTIGRLLFSEYVFVFEAISALLVVATIGTMVLGHRERPGGKASQKEWMKRRFREGGQLTPLPGPPVYATNRPEERVALNPAPPAAGSKPTEEPAPGAAGTSTDDTSTDDTAPAGADEDSPVGAGRGSAR